MAQSPSMIQHARSTMNGVSNRATAASAASNEALGVHDGPPSAATARAAPNRARHRQRHLIAGACEFCFHETQREERARRKSGCAKRAHGTRRSRKGSGASCPGGGQRSEWQQRGKRTVGSPDSKYNANGRRDPFISPVVSHAGGSGCSTGKKCLEIGNVNLRGVVRSEGGFIAVVSNGLNKAYFCGKTTRCSTAT